MRLKTCCQRKRTKCVCQGWKQSRRRSPTNPKFAGSMHKKCPASANNLALGLRAASCADDGQRTPFLFVAMPFLARLPSDWTCQLARVLPGAGEQQRRRSQELAVAPVVPLLWSSFPPKALSLPLFLPLHHRCTCSVSIVSLNLTWTVAPRVSLFYVS